MKIIIKILISLSLGVTLYALPPEVKRDQYVQGLEKAIEAQDYVRAKRYFSKLYNLVKEHKVEFPSAYYYFKAQVHLQNQNYKKAYEYAEKYINKSGTEGKFYDLSLEVLEEAEYLIENPPGIVIIGSSMYQDNSDAKNLKKDWQGAKEYCSDLGLGGYSDWYLPSKDELEILYDDKLKLNNVAACYYWSNTEVSSYNSNAWGVSFFNGTKYYGGKSSKISVRCVRDNK